MNSYSLSEERKIEFAGVYLLGELVRGRQTISSELTEDQKDLAPILTVLQTKNYIEIVDARYGVTVQGKNALESFTRRYYEYLNIYDVYALVDLQEGEFAFESYFECETQEEWEKLTQNECWSDLRIAVISYLKLDPIEIVFMQLLQDGSFGRTADGRWNHEFLLGSIWNTIIDICESAIQWEELDWEDDEGVVPAEDTIKDIITNGSEIIIELHKQGLNFQPYPSHNENSEEEDDSDDEYVVEEVVEEYPASYWGCYMNPFYVAPIWYSPWW